MELEAVGAISMGNLTLKVGGQVDNGDGVERAFLGADTTTDAEGLGNEGETRIRSDFNTELATSNNRARFLAFLSALAGTALYFAAKMLAFVVDGGVVSHRGGGRGWHELCRR